MSQMTRPEEGERGLGASHRRGGMGVASYRRPPEGLVKALDRVESPTSKAPVAKRKVESMRDQRAKRPANRKLHIDDGCMGGGEAINFYKKELCYEPRNGDDNDFYDIKWGNDWDKDHNEFLTDDEKSDLSGNHFSTDRWGIFKYCLFGDMFYVENDDSIQAKIFGGRLGMGEIITNDTDAEGGDDIRVSAGHTLITSSTAQAGVFMHELGHTLALTHYDTKNYRKMVWGDATHESCMSYALITRHVNYADFEWDQNNQKGIEIKTNTFMN